MAVDVWFMRVAVLYVLVGMCLGIALQIARLNEVPAVVIVGSLITLLGMLIFAALVWTRLGR